MPALIEKFRKYKNAFEAAVQDEDTAEAFGGWSDIIKQDTELLAMVTKMVDNKDNDEGRKMAVLLCKHRKESVRYISDKVMKREPFEVVDRTTIEL
jgi:hypothetical protein